MDVHDLLKLYKHGYSKVTDHASREISFGRISREEGLTLVRKHELADIQFSNLKPSIVSSFIFLVIISFQESFS